MDSCFGLFEPHRHGIANKQAQVPQEIRKNESVMLVRCGWYDKHR